MSTYRSKNEIRVTSSEISKKLYEDALIRREVERSKSNQKIKEFERYKTSEKSNEVYSGRILK